MSSREREVKVTILGEDRGGARVLNQLDDQAGKTESRFSSLRSGVGAVAGAFAGLAVGGAAVSFLRGAYEEAEEARKTLAQTEAVLKSTGGAAHVTAAGVGSLADKLSGLTGIDDEAIASTENLLLTFTNIRNEAGRGNDIFNQSTKAVLDMSVALGQDSKSSAIQLGKALNDPIAGITALQRVGVSFTSQQKDQIKTLVESGHTLEAQKLILAEINKEFGGSAEAAASPIAKLKVSFKNLEETVGTALMPVLATVATFLATALPVAIQRASAVIGPLVEKVKLGAAAFKSAFSGEGVTSDGFVGVMERIGVAVRQVVDLIEAHAKPVLIGLGSVVAALAGPWFLLAAAVIYAYTHFTIVRTIVEAVVAFLTGVVVPAITQVAAFIADQFGNLVVWVQQHWAAIQEAIGHVIAVVQVIIETFIAVIQAGWALFGDQILAVAAAVWSQIQNVIETVVRIIGDIISVALDLINGDWGKAWGDVMDIVDAAWDYIRRSVSIGIGLVLDLVGGIPGDVLGALGDLGGLLWDAGADLLRGMIGGLRSMAGALADAALAPVRGAVDAVKRFLHIGSPSKLFEGFGRNMGEGLVLGMGGSETSVAGAARSLAAAAGGGAGNLAGLALSNSRPPASNATTVIVNVAGHVMAERDLTEAVQAGLLQKQRRVPSLGLSS